MVNMDGLGYFIGFIFGLLISMSSAFIFTLVYGRSWWVLVPLTAGMIIGRIIGERLER